MAVAGFSCQRAGAFQVIFGVPCTGLGTTGTAGAASEEDDGMGGIMAGDSFGAV